MIRAEQTVAEIVLEHSVCAPVFQQHRIDYCCQGDRSLTEAAQARGIEVRTLVEELEQAIRERQGGGGADPRELSSKALIDHIVATHHAYLRRALPFVETLSAKVARVHGDSNPKLVELKEVVSALREDLEPHLDMEEQRLFPSLLSGEQPAIVRRELDTMHQEHLAVAGLLERMRDASEDFLLPEWACNSYRTLFGELEAMEGDILRHVHLENHVLMARYA